MEREKTKIEDTYLMNEVILSRIFSGTRFFSSMRAHTHMHSLTWTRKLVAITEMIKVLAVVSLETKWKIFQQ